MTMAPPQDMPASLHATDTANPPAQPDYIAFLQQQLATQPKNIGRHRWGDEEIWVKRAGTPHSMGRYRAMGALAGVLRLEVLRPVPNPGGPVAIATEVRRLRELAALGIRVPVVLAAVPDGFAMRTLGHPGEVPHSLGNAIRDAVRAGDPAHAMELWQQGLEAMAQVHQRDACLSQAFARNMVCCPDGAIACIDFEDDPAAVLPLPVCHARDALCYAHSTAIYLHHIDLLPHARQHWAGWVAQSSVAMQTVLATSIQRMGWMRHLPQSRRLGRDMQRVRVAYDLLAPNDR